MISFQCLKSLPNDKILDWSKLKAFADDLINLNQKLKFDMGRVENIVGKGENASWQHFFPFPTMFSIFSRQESTFELYFFCHLQMLSVW